MLTIGQVLPGKLWIKYTLGTSEINYWFANGPMLNLVGPALSSMTSYSVCCSYIAIWDTKPPKGHTPSVEDAKQKDNPLAVATTFKHLDLTWKPTLKGGLVGDPCHCTNYISMHTEGVYFDKTFNGHEKK